MDTEQKEADVIMAVLQGALVAIDNALLRGAMPDKTVKQLEIACANLKAIGVCYPTIGVCYPIPEEKVKGMFNKGDRVRIVAEFHGAGRCGVVVGEPVEGRDYRYWIPVLFDDEDDPNFFKDGGLEKVN